MEEPNAKNSQVHFKNKSRVFLLEKCKQYRAT